MKSLIYQNSPFTLQNLSISIYNSFLYRRRHAGTYSKWRNYFLDFDQADADTVAAESSRRLFEFLKFAVEHSEWYSVHKSKYKLNDYPILEKSHIINNLDKISTVSESRALSSFTGGTTGASMKVYSTLDDLRERFALLDHFRGLYGYKLGEKVAWFSGKSLATQKDVNKGYCYRDDWINKIRFFSTFHIKNSNFSSYWSALEEFQPKYIVGFPSSVYEIARIAQDKGLQASYKVVTMFPTAETVLPMHRAVIGQVFHTRLVDQYASSEGAPFILECRANRLHVHPLSGIFEVIDNDNNPSLEGEILVTSFTSRGTPLIRYRIGDRIRLSDPSEVCGCGSPFPMVDWIDGRTSDFIWSEEKGRINLGNLSNSTKGVKGIECFQVIQSALDSLEIFVVGNSQFVLSEKECFVDALRVRVGKEIKIHMNYVDNIPRENSGKFRIVKNLIAEKIPQ